MCARVIVRLPMYGMLFQAIQHRDRTACGYDIALWIPFMALSVRPFVTLSRVLRFGMDPGLLFEDFLQVTVNASQSLAAWTSLILDTNRSSSTTTAVPDKDEFLFAFASTRRTISKISLDKSV